MKFSTRQRTESTVQKMGACVYFDSWVGVTTPRGSFLRVCGSMLRSGIIDFCLHSGWRKGLGVEKNSSVRDKKAHCDKRRGRL